MFVVAEGIGTGIFVREGVITGALVEVMGKTVTELVTVSTLEQPIKIKKSAHTPKIPNLIFMIILHKSKFYNSPLTYHH